MRIYISGPITGTEDYKSRFLEAEKPIKAAGHVPMNPVEIVNLPEGSSWEDYMKIDLKLIEMCDAIYMLHRWDASKGACIEFEYAYEHKMMIFFEGGEIPDA